MSFAPHAAPTARQLVQWLVQYPKRWLLPAAAVALATAVYAVVSPATWEASQALIIRNEAANHESSPGKFRQPEDMKTVQETILELARSRSVLAEALKHVGPPADYSKPVDAWPDDRDIASLKKKIRLSPPKGAEFGKTEVFYLNVQQDDRQRAMLLNQAVCDQMQLRFQQIRDAKAQSMIDELLRAVHLAKAELEQSTEQLTAVESKVGSDLAELRALQEPASADSALRRTATEIRSELRELGNAAQGHRELLALLQAAADDPGRLVATPNRLLESQPALRRLKEGVIDAQLQTARLQGTMSAEHPKVIAAHAAIEEVARHLHAELPIAIRGVEAELRLSQERTAVLETRLAEVTGRLDRLSGLRAAYAGETAENHNRIARLDRAEQNLAEARAAHAGATAASLISRIDAPDTGAEPIGLSRPTIALLGLLGGLLTGLGILYLTVPTITPSGTPLTQEACSELSEAPAQPAAAIPSPNGTLSLKKALERLVAVGKA